MGGWGEALVGSLQSSVVSKSLLADGRWLIAATSHGAERLGFPARLNERGLKLPGGADAPSARPSEARLPANRRAGARPPRRGRLGPRVHREIANAQIFSISQRPPAISDLLTTGDWRLATRLYGLADSASSNRAGRADYRWPLGGSVRRGSFAAALPAADAPGADAE
jgi:hypothetical protein